MNDDYDNQGVYIRGVEAAASERAAALTLAATEAFSGFLERREVDIIRFERLTAEDLGVILQRYPSMLKPLLTICNLAGRAVERDLGLRGLNTYKPKLSMESALVVAGYVKSFLPSEVELDSLVQVDRIQFIDKEIRSFKGAWERRVTASLDNLQPGFRKRKFVVRGESFEIDAAWPGSGDIRLAVDVKRIEARRDIHKRCDEIINKAQKFRKAYPKGRFAAVVYYPFVTEHQNVRSRLRSPHISAVYFAGASQESIDTSSEMLLAELREVGQHL